MINRIDELKGISKFKSFTWNPKVPEFSKVNIIFGYNGSGKTAISNVFRLCSKQIKDNQCNELFRELSADGSSCISITVNGKKKKYSSDIEKKDIYVFNSDFIADHVYDGTSVNLKKFDESVVTQEQLKNPEISKLEAKINELKDKKKTKQKENDFLERKFKEIRDELSKEFNTKITESRFPIAKEVPNVVIKKDEAIIRGQLDKVYSDYEMSKKQKELKSDIEKIRKIQFEKININLNLSKEVLLKDISKDSREKIKRKIQSLTTVKLKRSASLNEWFEDGLEILKDTSIKKYKICPLCDSDIRNNLDKIIKDYETFFSDEYMILIESLNTYIEKITNNKDRLNGNNESLVELEKYILKYGNFTKENIPSFKVNKSAILNSLTQLENYLNEKKKNMAFKKIDTLFIEKFRNDISSYNNTISIIKNMHKTLLKELEERNYDPESLKKQARNICKDLLYIKFDNYKYGNQIHNYNQLKNDIDSIEEEIAKKDQEKREIIATLKNESRYINNFLKQLGVCNFTVDINKNNVNENILINYQSGCIKNKIKNSLSEGEKTALAFAYFISKINYEIFDNSQANIKDAIVVLDDPVSSLDESRLYSTACLINNIFSNAKQLFIFSHNLIFLKFIGNLVGYPREKNHKKEQTCCRRDYFLSMFGELTLLPYSLSNYQTVYFQKFDDLLKYKKGIVTYDDAKIYIPNHIRVILETFLSFKFFLLKKGSGPERYLSPGLDKLIKQLKNRKHLFKDYQKQNNVNENNFLQKLEQIKRITDPQSHGTPQNINEFNFISEAELKRLANDTLDVICFIDRIHYDEIINRIN